MSFMEILLLKQTTVKDRIFEFLDKDTKFRRKTARTWLFKLTGESLPTVRNTIEEGIEEKTKQMGLDPDLYESKKDKDSKDFRTYTKLPIKSKLLLNLTQEYFDEYKERKEFGGQSYSQSVVSGQSKREQSWETIKPPTITNKSLWQDALLQIKNNNNAKIIDAVVSIINKDVGKPTTRKEQEAAKKPTVKEPEQKITELEKLLITIIKRLKNNYDIGNSELNKLKDLTDNLGENFLVKLDTAVTEKTKHFHSTLMAELDGTGYELFVEWLNSISVKIPNKKLLSEIVGHLESYTKSVSEIRDYLLSTEKNPELYNLETDEEEEYELELRARINELLKEDWREATGEFWHDGRYNTDNQDKKAENSGKEDIDKVFGEIVEKDYKEVYKLYLLIGSYIEALNIINEYMNKEETIYTDHEETFVKISNSIDNITQIRMKVSNEIDAETPSRKREWVENLHPTKVEEPGRKEELESTTQRVTDYNVKALRAKHKEKVIQEIVNAKNKLRTADDDEKKKIQEVIDRAEQDLKRL